MPFQRGLRHWGPCHNCAHVDNACSLRILSAFHGLFERHIILKYYLSSENTATKIESIPDEFNRKTENGKEKKLSGNLKTNKLKLYLLKMRLKKFKESKQNFRGTG